MNNAVKFGLREGKRMKIKKQAQHRGPHAARLVQTFLPFYFLLWAGPDAMLPQTQAWSSPFYLPIMPAACDFQAAPYPLSSSPLSSHNPEIPKQKQGSLRGSSSSHFMTITPSLSLSSFNHRHSLHRLQV